MINLEENNGTFEEQAEIASQMITYIAAFMDECEVARSIHEVKLKSGKIVKIETKIIQ